jgi:hypothetical protein
VAQLSCRFHVFQLSNISDDQRIDERVRQPSQNSKLVICGGRKVVSPCLKALVPYPGTSWMVRPKGVNVAPRFVEK